MENEISVGYSTMKKKNMLITLAMCAVCIGINFLLFWIVGALDLPLYLDCIGTVLASAFGGVLPGIFVGFATNIINCFSDPSSIYYGVLNVLIAVTAAYFAEKGWITFRKPLKLILLVLFLSLVGGGLGTLIPWFLDGIYFDSASIAQMLVDAGLSDLTAAQFLANMIMDLLDKTITVAIVATVITLVPQKVKDMLRFNGWKQRPMSKAAKDKLMHIGCRKISVRTKITLILIAAMILMGTVATGISFILFSNASVEQHTKLVEGVATVAAGFVDGDSIDRWLAEGEDSEGYKETEALLTTLKHSDSEIEYVYVYKVLEDGCHVVFDIDAEGVEGSPVGEVMQFDPSFEQYIPTLLAGGEIEPIISNDTFGYLLTVYKPIIDSSGKCAAYAACDVSMHHIASYRRNFITGMCSLFLAFFIVIFTVVLWVVEYHIVLPVNSMSDCAEKFAFDSNTALDEGVDKMKKLEIYTGDEIENLYYAIVKMAGDSVDHLEDIRRKNETIKKMQNALILVLADMVESRDKNTGDHVRKTAAYTMIIMKKMREKGFYTEQLTDKFIDDVANSAPLHDVGKIKVSDMVLNKPGRLTDAEFVLMQSHAAVGGDIIDQVINLVPEPDYLNEARNLAAYHHEKWNGKGYPNGLKGEEIPLSARIMAVADVFDALVSRRSYKEPFSFEQACDIIRDGAGSHFDPLVAEAFLDAQDEVRKVAETFGDNSVSGYTKDDHVDDSGQAR